MQSSLCACVKASVAGRTGVTAATSSQIKTESTTSVESKLPLHRTGGSGVILWEVTVHRAFIFTAGYPGSAVVGCRVSYRMLGGI